MAPSSGDNKKIWTTIAPPLVIFILFAGWMGWKIRHRSAAPVSETARTSQGSGGAAAPSAPNGGGTAASAGSPTYLSPVAATEPGKATLASKERHQAPSLSPLPSSSDEGCYTITYRHKALPNHSSDDECSHHRNQIKLGRADFNPSSLCIRVNGTPVRYQPIAGQPDELVIGPVAGPRDLITARFCVGRARCQESCAYPKKEIVKHDEFMDAIGGSDDGDGDGKNAQAAQWEAGDAVKNALVNKALDRNIREELDAQSGTGAARGSGKLGIFKDWISGDAERSTSCARAHAVGRVLAGE